ncbi:MAG: LppX_LprAFG lipoprotein [Ktedonobacteraceae bacterium]|nr:LppX_LprAFG lipoprotein [Ktedonobacteraceae bacterium]
MCNKAYSNIRASGLASLFIALILLLVACSGTSNPPTTPTAQAVISAAQTAIKKVASYHFNFVTENPGSASFVLKNADGDIVVPDRLRANANVVEFNNAVKVQFVSIKNNQYATDPITGKWMKTTIPIDPHALSDLQTGIIPSFLGHIQDPSTPTDSSVDNTPCWSINGKLDTKYLTGLGGQPTGSTVPVTICIGKTDSLPRLISSNGVTFQGDTNKTVYTLKLSKFDETLSIVAPI